MIRVEKVLPAVKARLAIAVFQEMQKVLAI
jgi:predicted transcriptional regulator